MFIRHLVKFVTYPPPCLKIKQSRQKWVADALFGWQMGGRYKMTNYSFNPIIYCDFKVNGWQINGIFGKVSMESFLGKLSKNGVYLPHPPPITGGISR